MPACRSQSTSKWSGKLSQTMRGWTHSYQVSLCAEMAVGSTQVRSACVAEMFCHVHWRLDVNRQLTAALLRWNCALRELGTVARQSVTMHLWLELAC